MLPSDELAEQQMLIAALSLSLEEYVFVGHPWLR